MKRRGFLKAFPFLAALPFLGGLAKESKGCETTTVTQEFGPDFESAVREKLPSGWTRTRVTCDELPCEWELVYQIIPK